MAVKKLLALAGALAIVALALAACGGVSADDAPPPTVPPRTSPPPPPPAPSPTPSPAEAAGAQASGGIPVTVALQDIGGSGEYAFSPQDFTFSVGDTVTFTMTSETEYHSFTVEDENVTTEGDIYVDVEGGETQTLTFTFDEPGEYELICVPHLTQGMVGVITVQ